MSSSTDALVTRLRSVGDGAVTSPQLIALSVVVPTRNEEACVVALAERLAASLGAAGMDPDNCELIFVDDSDDDTPRRIVDLASGETGGALAIGLHHRPAGERSGGLGGAVLEGLATARGEWVCVMDGDLQHPPEMVLELLDRALATGADLVVASRHTDGGSTGLTGTRQILSRTSAMAAKAAFPVSLAPISDPMSGFFIVRRDAIDLETLRPNGFKILLEIVVRHPRLAVAEVGFEFGARAAGESKASFDEGLRYLGQLQKLRSASPLILTRPRAPELHRYDVHGIMAVESEGKLPELEAFRVPNLGRDPDIRVRIGSLSAEKPVGALHQPLRRHLRYEERFKSKGFAAEVEITDHIEAIATPMMRRSPHVLYTNLVEPLMRWSMVERGYALVHGACIVEDGRAYMITARTDTGKTTTMLKLLDAHPYEFVSDDLTIVCPDGSVLPYPKPLTISNHTLHAVKRPRLNWRERSTLGLQSRLHSRSGRQFAFFLTRTGLPVATVNTLVQYIVPPPKYPVQRLVPGVQVAGAAKLCALFIISRGEPGLEWLEPDDAQEILLANCEDAYGFPPYHHLEEFMLSSTGEDLRTTERSIIADAFDGCPTALLSSNTLDWAERIPTLIEGMSLEDPLVPTAAVR